MGRISRIFNRLHGIARAKMRTTPKTRVLRFHSNGPYLDQNNIFMPHFTTSQKKRLPKLGKKYSTSTHSIFCRGLGAIVTDMTTVPRR
jgi:hypothetical protein